MPRRNTQEPLYAIVPEIERLFRQRRRETQLQRAMYQENQNAGQHAAGQNNQPADEMLEYLSDQELFAIT
ncbi:hypothetical protein GQ457_16G017750 [Hibiscus cannabinus]